LWLSLEDETYITRSLAGMRASRDAGGTPSSDPQAERGRDRESEYGHGPEHRHVQRAPVVGVHRVADLQEVQREGERHRGEHQAASALAAKTFLRSFWGAGVVLFTEQMYDRMGDQWASTFLAFLSLLCCAIPFLFWQFGARIRARSKYAYGGDDEEPASGTSSGSDDLEMARKRSRRPSHGVIRDDVEHDDDLRRAMSYVSNP